MTITKNTLALIAIALLPSIGGTYTCIDDDPDCDPQYDAEQIDWDCEIDPPNNKCCIKKSWRYKCQAQGGTWYYFTNAYEHNNNSCLTALDPRTGEITAIECVNFL